LHFLKVAQQLENFSPGLFIKDRSHDDLEPHQLSLCFSSPKVVINLVRNCPNITTLSLFGYEDLCDIVLHFISGHHPENDMESAAEKKTSPGLPLLEHLTLPDRSYVTEAGVRALLQYLPRLQTLKFPGNLGKVFDMDWEPYFGPHLALENFSHLMTVTSGGVENEIELDASEVECWEPTPRTIQKIAKLCPQLKRLKILAKDVSFRQLEQLNNIEELDAHLTWSLPTAGLEMCVTSPGWSGSLTSLDVTCLDNYSWQSIVNIGRICLCFDKVSFDTLERGHDRYVLA